MSDSVALVPLEQRDVDFYGDTVTAVLLLPDGAEQPQIYVPVRPLAEYLGLNWSGQYQRLQRDPVLSDVLQMVRVQRSGEEGGSQETLCLPIEYLNGWLFGVNVSRVKEALRDKVLRYQRECYRVLWQAFQAETMALVNPGGAIMGPVATCASTELVQIREMALAVARLADQQLQLEQRVATVEERLQRAAYVVGELGRRVGVLERRLTPTAYITEEQAAEVSLRVKALAELLTRVEGATNHYQSVFAELYRRFGVSSYKLLPQERYEAVVAFLAEWYEAVAASTDER